MKIQTTYQDGYLEIWFDQNLHCRFKTENIAHMQSWVAKGDDDFHCIEIVFTHTPVPLLLEYQDHNVWLVVLYRITEFWRGTACL